MYLMTQKYGQHETNKMNFDILIAVDTVYILVKTALRIGVKVLFFKF